MDFFYNDFDNCQGKVIDSLKMLLYQRHEDIFERIDFNNDNIFLEPLLYSYIMQPDAQWLDSIIYGYEKNKKEKIDVFTNGKGIIYIPQVGYFKTNVGNKKLSLTKPQNDFILTDENENIIDFKFEPIFYLDENIELVKTQHPLLKPLFLNENNIFVDVEIDEIFPKHIMHFNKALYVIKENYKDYFGLIKKSVKKVMIYEGDPYSFASIQAHNMIFLNANDNNDEIFFLDHILHEGAHSIFNTLTYDSKIDLFKVPFKTDLASITKDVEDHGELYSRFHGLFTQSNINLCMEICINKKIFKGKQHKELLGRFSSNMKRFNSGIIKFDIPDLYNKDGEKWYSFFSKRYSDLYRRNKELINLFDVSNQPYVFSYEIFDKTNP